MQRSHQIPSGSWTIVPLAPGFSIAECVLNKRPCQSLQRKSIGITSELCPEIAGSRRKARPCWVHGVCLCGFRGGRIAIILARFQQYLRVNFLTQDLATKRSFQGGQFFVRFQLFQNDGANNAPEAAITECWYHLSWHLVRPVSTILLKMEVAQEFPSVRPNNVVLKLD